MNNLDNITAEELLNSIKKVRDESQKSLSRISACLAIRQGQGCRRMVGYVTS